MLTYKQYQENHEGKLTPLLNDIISKSISNLNEQDRQLLIPGMADSMEKEFQQTKRGQEIQRIFVKIQDGVSKEIDRLIDNLKDHLHTVVHPAQIAYGQSFDSGIGGTSEEPGRLRQAMKDTYKDMGQPVIGSSGKRPAKMQRRGTIPATENYQITLEQHNEFKRTLDSLDEIFLIEVGPIDWAKSKIGAGLDQVAPGVKDKLKGWWQNVWHGSQNPLNPQNLKKWDVALDDILDTFSTQLKGRVKGIISQQFDPSKGLISKHIQNLAKPYHKDTGSSSAKPPESPSEAPEAPEASSATSSKDSGEEAPEATETPAHGIGTDTLAPSKKKKGKKTKTKKQWDVRDLIGDEPSSSEDEPKLKAPPISGDASQNAVDRVMEAIPKGSFSRKDIERMINAGTSETDIKEIAKDLGSANHDHDRHDHPMEEYLPAKKGIKSLEEYLREAKGKVSEQVDIRRSGFDPSTGKPSSTPVDVPVDVPVNDDQAAKKLLDMMDEHGGIEWRHMTFLDLETGNQFENPLEIMDEDLNKWADDIITVWKRQKKITKLSEKDVENMAYFHLDDMGFTVPTEHDPEKFDWFSKRHKEKTLDQIQKIQ